MAATDVYPVPRKNAIYRLTFFMQDTSGAAVTGITPVVNLSKDQAAPAAADGSVTEIANGFYWVELTAAEMNADTIAVDITGTGAVTTPIVFNPEEVGDIRVNMTAINDIAGAAQLLADSTQGMVKGVVSAAVISANTSTVSVDSLTYGVEATSDHFNDRVLLWIPSLAGTDNLVGQIQQVLDYALNTSEGRFTLSIGTEGAADNDEFILL